MGIKAALTILGILGNLVLFFRGDPYGRFFGGMTLMFIIMHGVYGQGNLGIGLLLRLFLIVINLYSIKVYREKNLKEYEVGASISLLVSLISTIFDYRN